MTSAAQKLWVQGNGAALPVNDLPTQFDLRVKHLGLADSPERWAESPALQKWVKGHKNHSYVPEWLLRDMGLMGFYEGE